VVLVVAGPATMGREVLRSLSSGVDASKGAVLLVVLLDWSDSIVVVLDWSDRIVTKSPPIMQTGMVARMHRQHLRILQPVGVVTTSCS
jgi:hypothetical protein